MSNIIKIQNIYRMYHIRKNILIPHAYYQTKIDFGIKLENLMNVKNIK